MTYRDRTGHRREYCLFPVPLCQALITYAAMTGFHNGLGGVQNQTVRMDYLVIRCLDQQGRDEAVLPAAPGRRGCLWRVDGSHHRPGAVGIPAAKKVHIGGRQASSEWCPRHELNVRPAV